MSFRVFLAVSPKYEDSLFAGVDVDKFSSLLLQAIHFLRGYKHIAIFKIPNNYQPLFYQHKILKPVLDLIQTAQSNVIFASAAKKDFCLDEDARAMFQPISADFSTRKIVNLLSERNHPIVLAHEDSRVVKNICDMCAGTQTCSKIFDEPVLLPSNFAVDFLSNVVKVAEKFLDFVQESSLQSKSDFLQIIYAKALAEKIPPNSVIDIGSIVIQDDFFNDIRGEDWDQILDIAFSIYRAANFPSAQDRMRKVAHSIDWHINNPAQYNDFDLYRCDVVAPTRTGIRTSGAKRMLFAKYKNKNYFLAYAGDHDFSEVLIKARTLRLKQDLKLN